MTRDPEPRRRRFAQASLIAAGLLLSSAAFAASPPNANLVVSGQILPGACTIQAANGGTIDYGILPATQLNRDTDTDLHRKNLDDALEIHCPAATRISLTVSDNRHDSAGGNNASTLEVGGSWFAVAGSGAGLGRDSGGHKLGGYAASIGGWSADSSAVIGVSIPGTYGEVHRGWGGLSGDTMNSSEFIPGEPTYAFSRDGSTIVSAKDYALSLSVAANIAPAKTLTLDRPVRLDGAMLFTLNYL
ncbi:DUF1120 domain-containing protein [Burkholderia ubonensis]|uniref:DUF1120 domain-containing protein n=1 Tax=Burkholderia ubonensis TaxID=101571 RepID=UPI0012FB8487|nr:DUF1120 domain-containing protein [Burkholderia ubonensis]